VKEGKSERGKKGKSEKVWSPAFSVRVTALAVIINAALPIER
jgi:hypothetical protein